MDSHHTTELDEAGMDDILKLIARLEQDDDVQAVFHNKICSPITNPVPMNPFGILFFVCCSVALRMPPRSVHHGCNSAEGNRLLDDQDHEVPEALTPVLKASLT